MSFQTISVFWCIFVYRCFHVDGAFPSIKDDDCCTMAMGNCRDACQQVSTSEISLGVIRLKNECPSHMVEFWNCMNETIAENIPWYGRVCCNFSLSERCEVACKNANSLQDIKQSCRKNDQPELYECISYQQKAEQCCSNTQNSKCFSACKQAFQNEAQPYEEIIDNVENSCLPTSSLVLQCVQNYTRKNVAVDLSKYLHCCEDSPNKRCKETCNKLLRTKNTINYVISELQNGGCGVFLLQDKFWQCFLQKVDSRPIPREPSSIKSIGIDSAKLHCCFTATTGVCKDLCIKTFTNEWTSTSDSFIKECLSFPSEEKLQYCLDDIEEPCELGCNGLSYCTNFNRPTELFRSCTVESDEAARQDVALWQSQGFINVFGFQLPFRNITQCNPSVWKAFACILQIKPCQTNTQTIKICKEDCHELLNQCLDWNRIPPGLSTSLLCSRFDYMSSENPENPCVSVKTFLQPAKSSTTDENRIVIPCKDNPCDKQDVCLVDRQCQGNYQRCSSFQCIPGCRLGEVSEYLVPVDTHIRLPVKSSPKELCYKTCKCSVNGMLSQCEELPCIRPDSCIIGDTRIEHGSQFIARCNICSCYAGEVICTKKHCSYSGIEPHENTLLSAKLPCNCLPHFVPVCGRNGKTYHNSCLARCAGLTITDFTVGECSSQNACDFNYCKFDEICVPERKVCLSLLSKPCPQYKCVNFKRPCNKYPENFVCDEDNEEHRNLCYLFKKNKKFAYEGRCVKNCNKYDIVCGTDGNTYASECSAHANYIQVDYTGPCAAVGSMKEYYQPCVAQKVKCAPLTELNCQRIIPPGACCPVCAGAFRVLYSQKQVDRIIHDIGPSMTEVFTVKTILKALERYIRVADCTIRGYSTIESDIVIMVMTSNPWKVQSKVCQKEAEKLAFMIQTSSPRITSELSLSVLITAVVIPDLYSTTTSFYSNSNAVVPNLTILLLFLCLTRLFYRYT